jgi:hypothetical protein
VGGGFYYNRSQTAAGTRRLSDPGLAVLLSIRTLEADPATRLSREQIARVLPFIKALKDVPLSDAEAARAIAGAVTGVFTPAQSAAIQDARKRFQAQRVQEAQAGGSIDAGANGTGGRPRFGGQGGPGLPRGDRPGTGGGLGRLTDDQLTQFRARAFDRMIQYLEQRMK